MSAFQSKVARALVTSGLLLGCGEEPPQREPSLTRAELLDPETCAGCHPRHYREWASSMHAYAADDPVFRAMNARGQRETGRTLGDFCVRCHAPMALREGATSDGLNLAELPKKLRGVTCYFCHNAVEVGEHFNNDLRLANDDVMRGGIVDPRATAAHRSSYSPLHDRNHAASSTLCGSCHDVVTPKGVHLERTFREYEASLFAKQGAGFETCSGCHMAGRAARAAPGSGMPERTTHEHLWPGVDVALTEFPDREVQRMAVECALSSSARVASIEQDSFGGFTVALETSAGHAQPSGTALDRRLWIEFIAYDASGGVLFQSGVIGDGEREEKSPTEPGYDPQLTLYRDWIYDAQGTPKHMFWEAAPSPLYPNGYTSLTLPAATALGVPHTLQASYRVPRFREIARVTVRLRMRPVGIDVLEGLVASGDLDPGVIAEMPTFTLHGASVEWRPGERALRSLWPATLSCPNAYLCAFDPDAQVCTSQGEPGAAEGSP